MAACAATEPLPSVTVPNEGPSSHSCLISQCEPSSKTSPRFETNSGACWAPIKPEYICGSQRAPSASTSVAHETNELKRDHKRQRGQNKRRPRPKRQDYDVRLCPSAYKPDGKCLFGEQCLFCHDAQKFWAERPEDINSELCPLMEMRGTCPFGVTCRFAGVHTNPDDLSQISKTPSEAYQPEINTETLELAKQLRKHTYGFEVAERAVKAFEPSAHAQALDPPPCECELAQAACTAAQGSCAKEGIVSVRNIESLAELTLANQNQAAETLIGSNDKIGPVIDSSTFKLERKLKRGDFANKLYLAPLTTVGNLPFRRVCLELGAEITCGEMALATSLLQGSRSEWSLVKRHPSERMFGVQLAGAHADTMAKCAQLLAEQCDIDFIDLNLGCPIDLICGKGAGCSLMGRPTRLRHIAQSMCAAMAHTKVGLTCKMRSGLVDDKNTAHTLITNLQENCPIEAFAVHGRSSEFSDRLCALKSPGEPTVLHERNGQAQRYTRLSNWGYVEHCAEIAGTDTPVFGCGDVLSYEDYAREMRTDSPLAGVMIGRGALIKPWLFTEIHEQRLWDITANERLDVLKKFVHNGLDHWGSDQQGVDTTRRFLLEWLSFLHRYIPVGLLEVLPQKINHRPPAYFGRNELETLMCSEAASDWVKITELLLGKVNDDFVFVPKHKANSY